MSGCTHDRTHSFYAGSSSSVGLATTKVLGWRCADCREYLSLGPANDDDQNVKIEIRACELFVSEHLRDEETAMEWAGRTMFGRDETGPIRTFGGNAGWLMAHMANNFKEP